MTVTPARLPDHLTEDPLTSSGLPTAAPDAEIRRFINDCNLRRHGWAGFQKSARQSAERMVHQMTALDAYDAAQVLADHGRSDSDSVTTADIDTAADLAGVQRPTGPDDRHTVRLALDAITRTITRNAS